MFGKFTEGTRYFTLCLGIIGYSVDNASPITLPGSVTCASVATKPEPVRPLRTLADEQDSLHDPSPHPNRIETINQTATAA